MTPHRDSRTRSATLLVLLASLLSPTMVTGQAPAHLLVSVLDATGAPVAGLTRDDFTVRRGNVALEVTAVEPAPTTVQVVAIFEGLAVTQRQLSGALAQFIESLDDESVVDMQSVEGEIDAAIVEAIADLETRAASRPVILMLGQASEIAPSDFQSSQVRGRRRAADLTGDIDRLVSALTEHGIPFYGVSAADVELVLLANFDRLADATGGRFEILAGPEDLGETVAGIGRELSTQYRLTLSGPAAGDLPVVTVSRPDAATVRATPVVPAR